MILSTKISDRYVTKITRRDRGGTSGVEFTQMCVGHFSEPNSLTFPSSTQVPERHQRLPSTVATKAAYRLDCNTAKCPFGKYGLCPLGLAEFTLLHR
jgi:hypothetical protein